MNIDSAYKKPETQGCEEFQISCHANIKSGNE